jgi:D-serine dehydratase
MKQSWIRRALERTSPEENTTTVDPRLQNLEKIRETSRPNAIENAITQYAEAIQTVNRRKKELAEAQNALNRWAEVTANLLNAETSSERTLRFNKVNNT